MRASGWFPVMAAVCSAACNRGRPVAEASSLTQGHFATGPAFFMASEGRVVFPTSDAATRGIEELRRVIRHIELRWEDSVRVDPLAPGLAVLAAPTTRCRSIRRGSGWRKPDISPA